MTTSPTPLRLKDEADQFMQAFDGKPFDPRDRGGGQHWMHWYKGKAAKRDRNRSRHEFQRFMEGMERRYPSN